MEREAKPAKRSIAGNILVPLAVVLINAAVLLFPGQSLEAAREGLSLWLNNVLPSLLPFAVGVNLLAGLGAVRFIGTMLEPIMRPLFGVPGSGGFALVSGLMSGYPLGAKVTAELRADGSLTRIEAQRLIAFTNNSGPLFIIGAVGAGMFKNPAAGYLLYVSHILGAITVGLLFRSYKREGGITETHKKKLVTRAYDEMTKARGAAGFGQILGSGVMKSMETLLHVGGYIILFSVITSLAKELGLFELLERITKNTFTPGLIRAAATGFLEVTNGMKAITDIADQKTALIAAAGLTSWGGLSVHAQALSMTARTDIKTTPYILAKALQSVCGIAWAFVIYPLFPLSNERTVSAFAALDSKGSIWPANALKLSVNAFFMCLIVMAILSGVIYVLRKLARK